MSTHLGDPDLATAPDAAPPAGGGAARRDLADLLLLTTLARAGDADAAAELRGAVGRWRFVLDAAVAEVAKELRHLGVLNGDDEIVAAAEGAADGGGAVMAEYLRRLSEGGGGKAAALGAWRGIGVAGGATDRAAMGLAAGLFDALPCGPGYGGRRWAEVGRAGLAVLDAEFPRESPRHLADRLGGAGAGADADDGGRPGLELAHRELTPRRVGMLWTHAVGELLAAAGAYDLPGGWSPGPAADAAAARVADLFARRPDVFGVPFTPATAGPLGAAARDVLARRGEAALAADGPQARVADRLTYPTDGHLGTPLMSLRRALGGATPDGTSGSPAPGRSLVGAAPDAGPAGAALASAMAALGHAPADVPPFPFEFARGEGDAAGVDAAADPTNPPQAGWSVPTADAVAALRAAASAGGGGGVGAGCGGGSAGHGGAGMAASFLAALPPGAWGVAHVGPPGRAVAEAGRDDPAGADDPDVDPATAAPDGAPDGGVPS